MLDHYQAWQPKQFSYLNFDENDYIVDLHRPLNLINRTEQDNMKIDLNDFEFNLI